MNIENLLKDYGELISITLIPFIIWGLGTYFQNRKAKKDAELNLFLQLMANRKGLITKEWVDSLNLIDVVFQDNMKIRKAWRDYYDSLNPLSQHNSSANSFQLDLLSEIANHLHYKNLKQTEIDRFYVPKGLSTAYNDLFMSENLRVLSNSKAYGVAFSPEEFEEHSKNLEEYKRIKGIT